MVNHKRASGLSAHRFKWAWIGLFSAGALLRVVGIANTSLTSVLNMPLPDDAFYYFTLARNLVAGRGPVISGDGVITTGFQPLWGFSLAVANGLLGGLGNAGLIHLAQIMGALIGLAAAVLLAVYTRELGAGDGAQLLIVGSYLLSPQVGKHNLNGLETALAFAGLLGLGVLFLRSNGWLASRRSALVAGLASGIAVLARVDLVIFIAAASLLILISSRILSSGSRKRAMLSGWAIYAGGVLIPLIPWLAFSFRAGGGLIPESGQAVRHLTLLVRHLPFIEPVPSFFRAPNVFIPYYLENAAEFSSAWIRQTPLLFPLTIPLFALAGIERASSISALLALPALAVWSFLLRRRGSSALGSALAQWSLFTLLLTVAYAVFIQGPWFYQRYAAPLAIMANALLITAIGRALGSHTLRRTAGLAAAAAIAAGFVALVWKGSYTWLARGQQAVPQDGFYQAAEALADRYPSDARVGVFSAGLIGYYAPQPVLALDGKVNGQAAQALSEGRMLSFLCRSQVQYLVDWPKMVRSLAERRSDNWPTDALEEVERVISPGYNDVVIYHLNGNACPLDAVASDRSP
ncbi:MAG: hypothetical protein WBR18_13055 [Anaerolineales bacterium]